jgi:hypothetical protein
MTPILEPPKPSMEAESPLRLRTVDHIMAVMRRTMTAKEPPKTATQNQGERRGRCGIAYAGYGDGCPYGADCPYGVYGGAYA